MTKHTILFLAANPVGTDRLALDEEARAIQEALDRSRHRDKFELITRWAAQPLDLLEELRKFKPTVVHFSGHGGSGAPGEPRQDADPRRDAVDEAGRVNGEHRHGLFFQTPDGRRQLVSTAALEETFGAAGSSVKLVVLNACYSELQAEGLLGYVCCVVGVRGSIRDDTARSFAIGFYGGLGDRESVAAAYRHGCAAIALEGLSDGDKPRLRVRDGVDAELIVLGEPFIMQRHNALGVFGWILLATLLLGGVGSVLYISIGERSTVRRAITVSARPANWKADVLTDTSISVEAGDTLVFTASGEWSVGAGIVDPDGQDEPCDCVVKWSVGSGDRGRLGAVIGRIGRQGRPFLIGRQATHRAADGGTLFLGANDDMGMCYENRKGSCYDDNVGSIDVHVTVH